ncbi:H+/Cl- antiporter ClcA [Elusimicrobium simillimum]|uniref:chloride channel protein n=1 Tax=Elusimicrobium simillimum TaxID=3143438 RepID=UPI003C702E86
MFKDQTGMFLNILKWFILSTIIGIIVGIADALFLTLLDASTASVSRVPLYFVGLPLVLWVTSLLARKVAAKHTDFSTDAAINKINAHKPVSLISTLKAFFLPIITITGGGSAGKEAPCADVGAGLASMLAAGLRLNAEDRRKLMICGVSAGFAGVFGVPISGAIFGLEVLWVGYIFYEVMFPAFVAGITAYQVTSYLGVEYVYHPITVIPVFTEGFFLKVLFAGIFFGLMSLLFIELMKFFRTVFRFISFKFSMFWRAFSGGVILVLIGLLVSPEYLGLGMDTTNDILHGAEPTFAMGSLFKMLTTAITFSAGGVGGIVTPIFFIGSQAGAVLSAFLEVDPRTMAALGVVAVLAGTTNAPLAASIMAIELFGPQIAPYAAVCCVISFLMTGQRSIFIKQKVSFSKNMDANPAELTKARHSMPVTRGSLIKLARHLIPQEEKPGKKKKTKVAHQQSQKPNITPQEVQEPVDRSPFAVFKHLFPNFREKEDNNKNNTNKNNPG